MSNKNKKYHLKCKNCGNKINDFSIWFKNGQVCESCGGHHVDVMYYQDAKTLINLVKNKDFKPTSLWDYFNFLPLMDRKNIISVGGEGTCPIVEWDFLAKYAKEKYNVNCKVYAQRHDYNRLTGTFKDLAGTIVASMLKEHGISNYVVASTGNIGVAYSHYLGRAGISLTAFIPETSSKLQEAEIGCYGQKIYVVKGDYARAKDVAKEFAQKNNILLSAGNFDPMRLEAKKTMVYEWLRVLPQFPTVFMQAISGGSGPIGVAKACGELEGQGVFEKMPRFILPQPNKCGPMADAWGKAKANGFPEGWQNDYPVYENPVTFIKTLSTGNPTAYPAMSQIVKESDGDIISVDEQRTIDAARLIAYEADVVMGPAAAVTAVGFFKSLQEGLIKEGDVVMLNIGEGAHRASEFMEKFAYTTETVSTVDECKVTNRSVYRDKLWQAIENID